jgi:hypothetical protein
MLDVMFSEVVLMGVEYGWLVRWVAGRVAEEDDEGDRGGECEVASSACDLCVS